MQKVKHIENKQEDETKTNIYYNRLIILEYICAYFTILTIISSVLSYRFKAKLELVLLEQLEYVNDIYPNSLHTARKTSLAVTSISVLLYSISIIII